MSKYKTGWMEFEEASYLSDLFQQIVTDCRVQIPLFEELVSRSSRLQASLSSMVTAFSSFLETSEKICYHAVESKSDPDMGLCLERIVTRHRHMELILKTLASILSDCLSTPVQSKLDTWRKRVSLLDKEHAKSHKKMKAVVKKKSSAVEKLSKKAKKKAGDAELAEEHELKNVEKSLLSTAATGWKQIIGQEFAMFSQVQSLGEVVDKIDGREEVFLSRAASEDTRSKFELERSFSVSVNTPGGSPFTTGGKSRSESCKSRQSFSSRHSSLDSHLDTDRASAAAPHLYVQSLVSESERCGRQSGVMADAESLWLSYSDPNEDILSVPAPGEAMTPLSPPPSGDWYQPRPPPCLPQRGGGPGGVAEPHYSVPRNNSRVSHVSYHRGHEDTETHEEHSHVIVTGVQHHADPGQCNGHHTNNGQDHENQSHHHRPEPELDKTPTNEAGRMMDLIEKLEISSESCSSGYDSNDVPPLNIDEK